MIQFFKKYLSIKKKNAIIAWKKAKKCKTYYLFLAPYAVLFTLFYVIPVVTSLVLSFTYFNVLEPPKFIGLQNYINLILADDVFLTAVKNTFLLAAITGPIGYMAAFYLLGSSMNYQRCCVHLQSLSSMHLQYQVRYT